MQRYWITAYIKLSENLKRGINIKMISKIQPKIWIPVIGFLLVAVLI